MSLVQNEKEDEKRANFWDLWEARFTSICPNNHAERPKIAIIPSSKIKIVSSIAPKIAVLNNPKIAVISNHNIIPDYNTTYTHKNIPNPGLTPEGDYFKATQMILMLMEANFKKN